MLTVDYDRWRIRPGELVLDLGCGRGRHTFHALKLALAVVSTDLDGDALADVAGMSREMSAAGEVALPAWQASSCSDARALPFADGAFDRVIASEVLEHIDDDVAAMREIARVLKPTGSVAITVPRWWPERVCWMLSEDYHASAGGHVRIYRAQELAGKLRAVGFRVDGAHHAHALHSPYWWLKCLFAPSEDALLPRLYHRFLVWDIVTSPRFARMLERSLNPILGKSLVVYATKEHTPASVRGEDRVAV